MKRYYSELMDEDYNSYEAAIPRRKNQSQSHCSSKASNEGLGGIRRALLVVNSMRASNISDIITVELD